MNEQTSVPSYREIDPVLSSWALRHSLAWLTDYQDHVDVVRTFFIGEHPRRVQVSVERPADGVVHVRVARQAPGKHRRFSADFECRTDELDRTLDVALETALLWFEHSHA